MTFRTDHNGQKFPVKSKLSLYYQVMVRHSTPGYDPYTVEYGIATRSLSEARQVLEKAMAEFPSSQAYITTLRLETSY